MKWIVVFDMAEVNPEADTSRTILVLHPRASDLRQQLKRAVAHGCGEPIRVTPQHIGTHYQFGSMSFRVGIPLSRSQPIKMTEMRRHIKYLLHSRPEIACSTQMKIDENTLLWMARQTFRTSGHTIKQRERSGRVTLRPISDHVVLASIDTNKVARGSAESTPSHTTFGSFHTHPEDAYRRHRVCIAFPSAADYQVSFDLYLSHGCCFHLLSSIEGIYLVTVKPSFARLHPREHLRRPHVIERWSKVIRRAYDDGYPGCSLDRSNLSRFQEEYIPNYLEYINRKPIFDVKFLSWIDATKKTFEWSYPSEKDNCILTDRQQKLVQKQFEPL